MATYGAGIDQSQHAKSVSHIIKIITNTEIRVHCTWIFINSYMYMYMHTQSRNGILRGGSRI